ncbi:MAG: MFS transporter [Pirellulales bacterium]
MSTKPHKASLLVIFLTVFIDLLGFGMVLPLLPIYGKQFAQALGYGEKDWQVGLLVGLLMSSFSAMQFLIAPLWGRLSDRIGRRPVLIVGLAGSVLFYAMFGVATVLESLTLLFVARIGAGIAGATISTAQAYIADITTLEGRTKGMALIGAAFGIGFTFGPLFGALALGDDSETKLGPGPGYAAAAVSAVALLIAIFKLKESLNPDRRPEPRGWINFDSLRDALAIPSVGLLLLAAFVCIFAFAGFESTLSLLLKDEHGAFHFKLKEVLYVFAFIGLTLCLVQGGIVRRLSGKVSDVALAAAGASILILGLALLAATTANSSLPLLLIGLSITVAGFSCFTPSINALVSRRSDPARQGAVLGVLQSFNSLARILGPLAGPMLYQWSPRLPLGVGAGMMAIGLAVLLVAAPRGHDFAS